MPTTDIFYPKTGGGFKPRGSFGISVSGGLIWFGDRVIQRLNGASAAGVSITAEKIRDRAEEYTYAKIGGFKERSGRKDAGPGLGRHWEVRGEKRRTSRETGQRLSVPGSQQRVGSSGRLIWEAVSNDAFMFTAQVGHWKTDIEAGTGNRGINYIPYLENGWSDRAGNWHSGAHMLQRAMNDFAYELPRAVFRAWRSGVGEGGEQNEPAEAGREGTDRYGDR